MGGAKPVPVNPRNYRDYKRGDIIVSLAGIVTNLALAVLFAILVVPLGLLGRAFPGAERSFGILQAMMVQGIGINLVLAFFNLLPIPPLDGSHVMKYLLPPAWGLRYAQLGRYGLLIVFLMLSFGGRLLSAWLLPAGVLYGVARGALQPYFLPLPNL